MINFGPRRNFKIGLRRISRDWWVGKLETDVSSSKYLAESWSTCPVVGSFAPSHATSTLVRQLRCVFAVISKVV